MVLYVLCLGVDFCAVNTLCVAEWPPIGKLAAHSADNMFSKYKYVIVNLVFYPRQVFGLGISF